MNRQEIEDELTEQLYTMLRVTSALQPKSDEEFIAVALPNLVLWAHGALTQAEARGAANEREQSDRVREALELILPMARGYAHEHDVGSNKRYVEIAASLFTTSPEDTDR